MQVSIHAKSKILNSFFKLVGSYLTESVLLVTISTWELKQGKDWENMAPETKKPNKPQGKTDIVNQ